MPRKHRHLLSKDGDNNIQGLAGRMRDELEDEDKSSEANTSDEEPAARLRETRYRGSSSWQRESAFHSKRKREKETEKKGEPSKKKKTTKIGPNWAILEQIWPANERLEALRDTDWIKKQTIGDLMSLHKLYEKGQEGEGTGQ